MRPHMGVITTWVVCTTSLLMSTFDKINKSHRGVDKR